MVQRNTTSKLGAQPDQAKAKNKSLASIKHTSQHQDGHKNRAGGTDLKKKMKKSSKPMKQSDRDCVRSPAGSRPEVLPQPGKPPPQPPGDISEKLQKHYSPTSAAATPQKQSPAKSSDGSPNYMKPTSSSDARKERLQVSNRNASSPISPDSKKLSRRNSNDAKPARTLTRTSSLKRVRNLTKTPSFKPARALPKKCPQEALCADIDVQRATCSSTLKDSMFPAYLSLSPEGTSMMRVCPYTYCSLNGHHHVPLPPLKCFISARRRLLKTQKNIRLGPNSPRGATAIATEIKEVDSSGKMVFDEQPAVEADNLNSSTDHPMSTNSEIFIEIYTTEEIISGRLASVADEEIIGSLEEFEDLGYPAAPTKYDESVTAQELEHYTESCDGMEHRQMDQEAMDQRCDVISTNNEIINKSLEKVQKVDRGHEKILASPEVEASQSIVDELEYTSEATDMDWEEELISIHVEYEAESLNSDRDEMKIDIENPDVNDKTILEQDNRVNQFSEIIPNEETYETARVDGYLGGTMIASAEVRAEKAAREERVEVPEAKTEIYHNLSQELSNDINSFTGSEDEAYITSEAFTDKNLLAETQIEQLEKNANISAGQKVSEGDNEFEKTKTSLTECRDAGSMEIKDDSKLDTVTPDIKEIDDMINATANKTQSSAHTNSDQQVSNTYNKLLSRNRCKRSMAEECEPRKFNPREPNFLPENPDPEVEKIALRHQMMDDRKNAEEWMLDYALQQAITKLDPARKRKVTLLVEAFETVTPCEPHRRHPVADFVHARPMQACS